MRSEILKRFLNTISWKQQQWKTGMVMKLSREDLTQSILDFKLGEVSDETLGIERAHFQDEIILETPN